ncbi:MAG: S-layer homology domain-containing protein [Oscillospiraceae bacterium]|nr:S-layer homology domain-containing protein [Oscillospiraceae bacterium]
MRQKRYFICLLPALLLAAALCLPARAFSKEPSSWAAEQCTHLEDVGLLGWQLYTGSTDPASAINRGAFCQMLVSLVQMEGDWEKIGLVEPAADGYFTDIPSVDSDYGMYYGAAFGITEGSTQNGQRVADARSNLTREQAAKMMCAAVDALETYGGVPAPQEGAGKSFSDQGSISAWAADSVARASRMGILQGDSTGNFKPQGTLTWQEACVMVDRLYTSAEAAVKARRAEQGIHMMDTAFEVYADQRLGANSAYYYALENGGQQSVLYISSNRRQVQLETYNSAGTRTGSKAIPMELEKCGGFYESGDNYFLAFGQDNAEENNSKTVFRVVKYDKNWNKLGTSDISDCFTTEPFRHTGHTAMAEHDGTLILHTSRQRYLTDDGLRHQSNFTAKIRVSDMTVLEQSKEFPVNHVSHSFAQYAAFSDGAPVYIDQGDGYPRGFAVNDENHWGTTKERNFFPFDGAIGDNATNAIPGGMGVSSGHYLFAGASSPQKGGDSLEKANAFLAVIPKGEGETQIKWLTSFPADGSAYVNDICLVEVNNNTFVVMWQVTRPSWKNWSYTYDPLQYAVFDGQGNQVGETKSLPGYIIPSGDPSVYGNRILWADPELDASHANPIRNGRYINIFELTVSANAETDPGEGQKQVEFRTAPDPRFPTMDCEVDGVRITRTDIPDKGATTYYREDWNGNWLEVSVEGDDYILTGRIQDERFSKAFLGVTSRPQANITPGEPFYLGTEAYRPELAELRHIIVAISEPWTSFPSGTELYTKVDESGKPTIYVWEPSGLTRVGGGAQPVTPEAPNTQDTPSAPERPSIPNTPSTPSTPSTPQPTAPSWPGETEIGSDGVIRTKLPADGVVTAYQEEFAGTWTRLEVVDGNTLRFSGSSALNGTYNYAVLRVGREAGETPVTAGVPFRVQIPVDVSALSGEGPVHVAAVIAQNYHPGDVDYGGYPFQSGARAMLTASGGKLALRIVNG